MSEEIEAELVGNHSTKTQALAVRPAESAVVAAESKPAMTAAQAKIEAVADLTKSCYAKAATLELTPEETAGLQADFPDSAFLPGAAGKEHLIYIEHAHLRDRFNAVFGMGKWAIVPRNRWQEPFKTQKGEEACRVYVEAMLVVRGCFVGEAVGAMEYYPQNASQNYGDAVEGAKTAAFRRCAKEFGVGLQAWKKEFCEAWWARKRGGRDFTRKPMGWVCPSCVQNNAAWDKECGRCEKPKDAPKATKPDSTVPFPTEDSRRKMINALKANPGEPNRDICEEYFKKLENPAQLMPNESLEDLPLRFVPATTGQMRALLQKIAEFGDQGLPASAAFPAHPEPSDTKPSKPQEPTKAEQPGKEWWWDVNISLPRKGMKRDDYQRNPDTIRKLFALRHGNDEEAQSARQRLWGLCKWEPKPREYNGKTYQPSDADRKSYEALQEFAKWFSANHPDEKL